MITHECQQGSDEWLRVRCGVPSASNFSKIITPAQGEPSKSQDGYINELIAERLEGPPIDGGAFTSRRDYQSPAMEEGIRVEPLARQWYKEHKTSLFDEAVKQVGFITDDKGRYGVSPDGLVYCGDDLSHGLELKCPMLKTHIGWWRAGVLPTEHKAQVHGGMAVTGLDRWDFVSFHPLAPALVIRVERDAFTEKLATALEGFADKLEEQWERVKEMMPEPEPVTEEHPF